MRPIGLIMAQETMSTEEYLEWIKVMFGKGEEE